MRLGPFPALGLNLARDLTQLLDGEHVEQARILEEPAPVLTEQVTDDVAARLDIGVGPDEHRAAVGGGHIGGGHVAPDDPRLAIMMQVRSEEHTSELQSLMRISYAVFCLKKKNYT